MQQPESRFILFESTGGAMNISSAFTKTGNTDFDAWARLLICRKVPDGYQQLVDSEVVHHGAEILKRGDAFEVRIRECRGISGRREILLTPFPN
jgi:hypothetical protein